MSENSNLLLYDKHILTSPFGMRIHPVTGLKQGHNGTDYGTFGKSPPIYSPFDGKVLKVGKDRYGGLFFYVDYGDYIGLAYHPSKITVKAGQTVKAGEIMAYVGSTGRSTGNHLHWGWIINNKKALDYYNADYVDWEAYEIMDIKPLKILVDGKEITVSAINYKDENYIRLRDFEDKLKIADIEYDKVRQMPTVTD